MSLFESWCFWLGRSPEELSCLRSKFGGEDYAERLWNPPTSELRDSSEKYALPFLDLFYQERASYFGLKRGWRWSQNAPYVVCLTHDIDRIFSSVHGFKSFPIQLSRLVRDGLSFLPGLKQLNAFSNWERQRLWEQSRGVKSASYLLFEKRRWGKSLLHREWQHVVGVYQPESIQPELERYAKEGNEIGLHYSFDSWRSETSLMAEMDRIEVMGLKRAIGGRSHYLNFSSLDTLRILNSLNMKYDSTMGFNYFNGFRCGTSFPYQWKGIWELPLIVMDSAWRSSGKSKKVFSLVDQVKATSGVLMLNWHHHTMNENLFPDEMKLLDTILSSAKKDGAWIATPSEVVKYVIDKASSMGRKKDEFDREQHRKGGEVFL